MTKTDISPFLARLDRVTSATSSAIERAKRLLCEVAEILDVVPEPSIVPLERGVVLAWRCGDRAVQMFYSDKQSYIYSVVKSEALLSHEITAAKLASALSELENKQ